MSNTSSVVTFVTAYMNIYPNNRLGSRDMIWRFEQFAKIAQTGIQLCVYVDESSVSLLDQFMVTYPNVRRMRVFKNITDTWVYQQWRPYRNMHAGTTHQGLPRHRNVQKDTLEYMTLMHTKMECMMDAMKVNPWNSTHFAWIDFNVAHVFRDVAGSQAQLRAMASNVWKRTFLAIPGCWQPLPSPMDAGAITGIIHAIHWRFCGGFFLGDIGTMAEFCRLYTTWFPKFLAEYNQMTWEVNFWAWMESKIDNWTPNWYAADHNDSILEVPAEWWSMCLAKDVGSYTEVAHECPELGSDFHASSASIVPMSWAGGGGYWMNTRYVNYTLADNGGYLFPNSSDRTIHTRNVCSRLDQTMTAVEHFEMRNPDTLVSIPDCEYQGVEDIRLWLDSTGQVCYVGTSVNYTRDGASGGAGKGRILRGVYDVMGRALTATTVVQPPTDTPCEKNWCPLPGDKLLYRCSDMTVGHVELGTGQFVVDATREIKSPWFDQFRGSTYFRTSLDYPGALVGLVHFSVHEWPRQYYHVLLLLDAETLRPIRRSQPFTFLRRTNIEFCIGMLETRAVDGTGGCYHFWVSQYDREPRKVTVATADLPLSVVL